MNDHRTNNSVDRSAARCSLRPGSLGSLAAVAGAVVFALLVSGTPAPPPAAADSTGSTASTASAATQQLDRLYFGRSMSCGGVVSDAQWNAFVAQVVTPRFPEGLTLWLADGQWRDDNGRVLREPTFVLEVLHEPAPAAEAAMAEIVATYKRDFCQQSVLWVRDRVDVRS
jgi:hypothetical protein